MRCPKCDRQEISCTCNRGKKQENDITLDDIMLHAQNIQKELETIKESRDTLLEAVRQSEIVFRKTGQIDKAKILIDIIQEAEDIKEKEALL